MSAILQTHDASRWTAIAGVVIHYLGAWLESGSATTTPAAPLAPIPKGMFQAAENFLLHLRDNIPTQDGRRERRGIRSITGLANYLMGLESLSKSDTKNVATALAAVESHLQCLRAMQIGEKVSSFPRERIEATLAFFRELERQGDRARANRFTGSELSLLNRV